MAPKLSGGVDHIHMYVPSRREAAAWYTAVLGFEPVPELLFWAEPENGPLTLRNPQDTIHLALFRSADPRPVFIAFGASGEEYLAWRAHLNAASMETRERDHTVSWSTYFHDPFGNQIEITSYDHAFVSANGGPGRTAGA